jgi:hypothetical protein
MENEIERLMGGPPRLTSQDIMNHPRLPEARKLFLDRFLEVYLGDRFLVRLLIESGRFLVYQSLVLLGASEDPARRETWVTVGLLKQKMTLFGFASSRHIDTLIARLCEAGFLELRQSEQDGRVRLLKTTEKMRAHDRDWVAAHYAPLTVLYPHHDYELVMQRDPAFNLVQRRTSMAFLPLGAKEFAAMPEMLLFMNRAGGYMVIAALLQTAAAKGQQHHAVPYADVGDRFGISRTHVRNLLRAAEDAGLVKLHARGGHHVEILPRLWSCHDRGMAGGMYIHDMIYVVATRTFVPRSPSDAS